MAATNIWTEKINNTVLLSVSNESQYGEQYNKDYDSLSIYPGHFIREIEIEAPLAPGGESIIGLSLCRTQSDIFSTLFAVENPYSGGDVNTPYLLNQRVMFRILNSGDIIHARAADDEYVEGELLTISDTVPGEFMPAVPPITEDNRPVAISMEKRDPGASTSFLAIRLF